MNCFIILLLLCCCGHSNGNCCENSCGCRENMKEKENCGCGRKECREERREERREEKRENRRAEECRRPEPDCCDAPGPGMRNSATWQDFPNYGRGETCGCEE